MITKMGIGKKHGRFVCATEHYNNLYSRYLKKPEKMLEMVDYKNHETLLDLCGGTGAISSAALQLGADARNITLLDLNPRFLNTKIRQISADAIVGLKLLASEEKKFDVIICRQAFAYLEINGSSGELLANLLAKISRPGTRFIFNSFIRPRWIAKTYHFEGARFIELAGYIRRKVFRFQIQLGKGYDFTISKWHREERIFQIFSKYFSIETRWSDNAVYWICTRQE